MMYLNVIPLTSFILTQEKVEEDSSIIVHYVLDKKHNCLKQKSVNLPAVVESETLFYLRYFLKLSCVYKEP